MELSVQRQLSSEPRAALVPTVILETSRIHWCNIVIVTAAFIAFFLKLAIAYNTFGTNDVASFYMFAGSLRDHGLEWTYRNGVIFFSNFPVFNHPPLTAYYLELIETLSKTPFSRNCGLTFPFLLRFPGIVADLISVFVVMRIRDTSLHRQVPTWAILLFALSPVSIMVSGFHGNTDPVMAMFLLLAGYMCLRGRPVWCGIFFAMSCQTKIIPLLLLPIVFLFWLHRRAATRFVIPFVILSLTLWIEPLTRFPQLFFRNVFSYNGYWGSWGISYLLKLTHWPQFNGGFFNLSTAATFVAWILKLAIICAVIAIAWRRRGLGDRAVIDSFACAWIVFFVFAPGVCPQYMVWLAPFVLLLSPKLYASLAVASSIALFFLYNALSNGLPWYIGIARNSADGASHFLPWELLPWITLIVGMIAFWSKAFVTRSSVREQLA